MVKYKVINRGVETAFTKKYKDIYTITKAEYKSIPIYRDDYIEPYSYDYEDLLTIEDSKGNQYEIWSSVFKSQFIQVEER